MGRSTKLKRITALHRRSSENVIAGGEARRGEESTAEKRRGEVRNTQIDGGKAKRGIHKEREERRGRKKKTNGRTRITNKSHLVLKTTLLKWAFLRKKNGKTGMICSYFL